MSDQVWIGIDPGVGGAVAAIGPGETVRLWDTPVAEMRKGKGKRREYQKDAMRAILVSICYGDVNRPDQWESFVIESSSPRPSDGTKQAFATGRGYGLWEGLMAGFVTCPVHPVTPSAWRPKMVGVKQPKSQSIVVAKRLFPQAVDQLTLKKHDGRAEALLIAEYGRRKFG